MSTVSQRTSGALLDAVIQREACQCPQRFLAIGIGVERVLLVSRAEAGGRHRIFGHHAKLKVVKKTVERSLVLKVAAGDTDGDNRLAVLKDYCRC